MISKELMQKQARMIIAKIIFAAVVQDGILGTVEEAIKTCQVVNPSFRIEKNEDGTFTAVHETVELENMGGEQPPFEKKDMVSGREFPTEVEAVADFLIRI